jgi:hypothetical protein
VPDEAAPPDDSRAIQIEFRHSSARVSFAEPGRDASRVADDLELATDRPVFLVIGGADKLDSAHDTALEQLFEQDLVPAASRLGATLMDGGTNSGVMAALGRAWASSDKRAPLVGVAPAGRVTFPGDDARRERGDTNLEPHHPAFALASSARWGGETPLLFDLAGVVAGTRPIVAVLAGGGSGALQEVQLAARRHVPIVVIEGTGGTADELAAAVRSTASPDADDRYGPIRSDADLAFLELQSEPGMLGRLLARLVGPDEVLREAWRLQKLTSAAAGAQQSAFHGVQTWILGLGLLVTTLVVAQAASDDYVLLAGLPGWVWGVVYASIIVGPIMITSLTAAQGRFRPGGRWILLRGASEALKRDIYRYRTRAGIFSPAQTRTTSPAVKLSEAIGSALGGLMRTDVSQLPFDAASAPVPEAKLARLSAAGYLDERVSGQIDYYTRTAAKQVRRARLLRILAITSGAVGSFLAAIGAQIWVAIPTALVALFTTLVESRQLEVSSAFYNQAAADLTAIRAWWQALPEPQQGTQATVDRLVERAERIMRAEHVGWVQDMQDAMTQFRLEQASDEAAAKPSPDGAAAATGSAGTTGSPGAEADADAGSGDSAETPTASSVDDVAAADVAAADDAAVGTSRDGKVPATAAAPDLEIEPAEP